MGLSEKFEEMSVISIDPSLRSSGVFTKSKKIYLSSTMTTKEDRLEALGSHLRTWLDVFYGEIDLILVEGYAFSKHSTATTTLAEVGGIIRACGVVREIPVVEIPSTFWKKHSGFGATLAKSTKEDTKAYIEHGKLIYDTPYKNTDEVDAAMIYFACKNALKNYEVFGVKNMPDCLKNLIREVKKWNCI